MRSHVFCRFLNRNDAYSGTPTTPASMSAEVTAFVDDIFASGGSIRALYTAPYTFANADLAPIYGIDVAGEALVRVDLDPTQRSGLLTLSGPLAVGSDATVHNPIRRGVFLDEAVLCVHLPPPPDDVTPLPPPDGTRTTRELVDAHTGEGTCGEGCHSTLINPPGFAFEHYDAIGAYRTEDNGQPVDATGSWTFPTGPATFDDAIDFAAQIADSDQAHRCYVSHWLSYLHGRPVADTDDGLLDRLAAEARSNDRPITELMVDLILSDSFRYRAPEEAP